MAYYRPFQVVMNSQIFRVGVVCLIAFAAACASPRLIEQARSIQVLSKAPTVPYRVLGKIATEPAGITTCIPFDKGPAQTLLRNEAFRRYGSNVNAMIDVKYESVYAQTIGHYGPDPQGFKATGTAIQFQR